jgi:hypothetical protein
MPSTKPAAAQDTATDTEPTFVVGDLVVSDNERYGLVVDFDPDGWPVIAWIVQYAGVYQLNLTKVA